MTEYLEAAKLTLSVIFSCIGIYHGIREKFDKATFFLAIAIWLEV